MAQRVGFRPGSKDEGNTYYPHGTRTHVKTKREPSGNVKCTYCEELLKSKELEVQELKDR